MLSGIAPPVFEIAEMRVLESGRSGYTPLFVRAPQAQRWRGNPREAAQTCSDTELVVPLKKLDRNRIMSTATRLGMFS